MNTVPKYGKIPAACAMSGVARTTIYSWIAEGKIRAVKAGSATLIELASVEAHLASLPVANITPPRLALAA
jgi:excisionase family DNA binding protein